MLGGSLNQYLQRVQRAMRDQSQKLLNPADIIDYINTSRRQVAMQAQCVRVIPPVSGQVVSITVTAGGTNYSSHPTITISAPDFPSGSGAYPTGAQATAHATVVGGAITNISVDFGGDGYFQPTVIITDASGSGATATAQTSPLNLALQGQEVYPFVNVPLGDFPGVDSILNVRSVSVIFSNWQYNCLRYPYQMYSGYIARYPQDYQYVPEVITQVGQGNTGELRGYPLPNQTYQWKWDCICLPSDMVSNDSPEAIPAPWTDAVPLLASYHCMLDLGNFNGASFYLQQFDAFMSRYSAGARPGGVAVNLYGRV